MSTTALDQFDDFFTEAPAQVGCTFHESVSERIQAGDMDRRIVHNHVWALRCNGSPRKLTAPMLEQFRRDLHSAIVDSIWALHPQFNGALLTEAGRAALGGVSSNLDAMLALCASSSNPFVQEAASAWMWEWLNVCQKHAQLEQRGKYGQPADGLEISKWLSRADALADEIVLLAGFVALEDRDGR
ncbi:hypothetical protein [Acidithiobacillus sulfuriphilus]|uniref:hypothetical protein n=1 Tax=Acidithiobacillus sulfuriphilus TaxID=1867749 RepID=UPI003F640410